MLSILGLIGLVVGLIKASQFERDSRFGVAATVEELLVKLDRLCGFSMLLVDSTQRKLRHAFDARITPLDHFLKSLNSLGRVP